MKRNDRAGSEGGTRRVKRLSRAEWFFLLALAAGALSIRIAYHIELRGNPLVEHLQLDEQYHDRWARSIASGDFIGNEVFFRAPLYPYLVGLLYFLFEGSPELVRLLQHLLGVVLVILVYFLSRHLFGRRTAMIASLLAALYGVMICFEGRLLFDFLTTLLTLVWLTLCLFVARERSWSRYAGLGLLYGLICIMRPPFLALAPLLFAYVIRKSDRNGESLLRYALVIAGACLFPILVVTARNAIVGNDAVLIASQGGINFYIGNNAQSDGSTPSVLEAGGVTWETNHIRYIAERSEGRALRPSEVSSYWYARALDFILSEPLAALRLTLRKLYLFWSHVELKNNQSYYAFEQSSKVLAVLPLGFWLVGTLGLLGAALSWNERQARLLLLFLALYCLVTTAFFVCDRFRLPILPVLFIFSGFAVDRIMIALKTHSSRMLLQSGLIALPCALLVNSTVFPAQLDVELGIEEVQAHAALGAGRFAEAEAGFRHIATQDPTNEGACVNLGIALWEQGKTSEAADAFRLAIGPGAYSAVLNLAHLFFVLQQMDSVMAYAGQAVRARPYAPGGYVIAAKANLAEGNIPEAERILREGSRACGNDFMYGEYLLAGIYAETGIAGADSIYHSVLARTLHSRESEYAIQSERMRIGVDIPRLHAQTLHGLGRLFLFRARFDSSLVYLRQAAALLPTDGGVWKDLGICLTSMGKFEEADGVMRTALRLDEKNPVLWFNYGTLLARRGDLEHAREAAQRALALEPDFEQARNMLHQLDARLSKRSP